MGYGGPVLFPDLTGVTHYSAHCNPLGLTELHFPRTLRSNWSFLLDFSSSTSSCDSNYKIPLSKRLRAQLGPVVGYSRDWISESPL